MPGKAFHSFISVLLILASSAGWSQEALRLLSDQAAKHVGEFAQVCGVIAGTYYARSSNGGPTYLNFDKPYPDNEFTVIVWRKDRKNFPNKPELLSQHKACVTGTIEIYRGKPQIVAKQPEQIIFWPLEPDPTTGD